MGSSDLRLQSNGLSFLTLIQVSRPGFYHISVALYLCGAASDPWALLSCRAILGLLFVVFPLNLIVYGMNDLRDVDIDKYNARKGGIYGAQASVEELQECLKIGVCSCLLCTPLLANDIVWAMTWSAAVIGVNWVYNFGPTLSRVPILDMFPPLGYLLIIPFGSKVTFLPHLPLWTMAYLVGITLRTQLWFQRFDAEADIAVGKRTTASALGSQVAAVLLFVMLGCEVAIASAWGCQAAQAFSAWAAIVLALELLHCRKTVTKVLMFLGGLGVCIPFLECLANSS
jgi:4-hydroxybenzoate polyprenyltransferase